MADHTDPAVSLTDFVLARVAKDELAAQQALELQSGTDASPTGPRVPVGPQAAGRVSVDAYRVLAECAANRLIVENHLRHSPGRSGYGASRYAVCCVAVAYADHADYRSEWRP